MRTTTSPPASTPDMTAYLRVHRVLRLSATQLADVISNASGTQRTRADSALIRWYRGFADEIRCHHHIEDELLFPALRQRVATYGEYGQRLDSDHADLDVVLDGLTAALTSGDRIEASRLAAELRDHLDEHLGFEDDEITPLFVRHFTAIEWDELNTKAVKMTSPKQLIFTAPWLMSHLDEAERAELLGSVPKALTLIWILTRGRYSRLAARAFGPTTKASVL